ncbi:hypothetical protein Fcan01_24626 [Folsomia candida]|uniref:Uncharacterized protein n=2 Tax=Folsomia candida TaxID=158441 RepID=A0A226D4S2_FOLCA|nr:hypothetical protein Fcan01_24626 [Folsomia candida]
MIGIVTRLAASRKMSEFKKTIPPRDDKMQMEERIANLYSKKWSTMTFNVLLKSFLKMLRNEVIQPDETPTTPCDDNNATTEKPVFIISPSFNEQFTASHSFLRAMSFLPGLSKEGGPPPPEGSVKTKRSMSVDACGISQNHGRTNLYTENWVDLGRNYALPGGGGDHLLGVNHGDIRKRSKSQDDINLDKNLNHPDGRFTNNDSSDMTWM